MKSIVVFALRLSAVARTFLVLGVLAAVCASAVAQTDPADSDPGATETPSPLDDVRYCDDLTRRRLYPVAASVFDYKSGVADATTVNQLNGIRTALAQTNLKTIVIYFHGGLVDRCSALSTAVDFGPAFVNANAYPIFPIYNIGYDDATPGLNGKYGQPIEDTRALSITTRTLRSQAERTFRDNNGRSHDLIPATDDGNTVAEERFRYAALVDGGEYRGGRMWSYMKWVVDQSLSIDTGLQQPGEAGSPAPIPALPDLPEAGEPAMRALQKIIADYAQTHATANIRVVLIGHSTGAVYIAKWLRAWQRDYARDDAHMPGGKMTFDVIMIAPAVRYDEFMLALEEAGDRVSGLRIFTMRDHLEIDAPELGSWFSAHLYRPSLLYAISGIFEAIPDTPILGMQRFWCIDETNFHDYPGKVGFRLYDNGAPIPHPDSEVVKYTKYLMLYKLATPVPFPFAFSQESSQAVPESYRTMSRLHGSFPYDPLTFRSMIDLVEDHSAFTPDARYTTILEQEEKCDPTPSPSPRQ